MFSQRSIAYFFIYLVAPVSARIVRLSNELPEIVRSCTETVGAFDIIVEVEVSTPLNLIKLLHKFASIRGVGRVTTAVVDATLFDRRTPNDSWI